MANLNSIRREVNETGSSVIRTISGIEICARVISSSHTVGKRGCGNENIRIQWNTRGHKGWKQIKESALESLLDGCK